MKSIWKREVKNYLKRPLLWLGMILVILGIFQAVKPYLAIRYMSPEQEKTSDSTKNVFDGDISDGYIPANEEQRRAVWEKKIQQSLISDFEMSPSEAAAVMTELKEMDITKACEYLKTEYHYHGANSTYEEAAYYKATSEEFNSYIAGKLEQNRFSYYFSRKFADFTGLYMAFFSTILLSVLFWQDTRKSTYELLHTKPISAGKYVMGKVAGGFSVCLIMLAILNMIFWGLCCIAVKDSGFEVNLVDFVVSTCLYILPNMLMIVCIYGFISLAFKNPMPAVPLLILYMVYSNMGGQNAEGVYGYYGRPLAIMVRFPGELFDTAPPPKVIFNQCFLIAASLCILMFSIYLWKRRRM